MFALTGNEISNNEAQAPTDKVILPSSQRPHRPFAVVAGHSSNSSNRNSLSLAQNLRPSSLIQHLRHRIQNKKANNCGVKCRQSEKLATEKAAASAINGSNGAATAETKYHATTPQIRPHTEWMSTFVL